MVQQLWPTQLPTQPATQSNEDQLFIPPLTEAIVQIPQGFLAQQEMFKEGLMAPPVLSPSGPQCHHLLHYLGQQLIAVPQGVAPYHGPPLGTPQQTTRLNPTPQLCLD